ncbi:MAG: class I SAM-dependent methyltransferase [Vicinamibacterales bacterium]
MSTFDSTGATSGLENAADRADTLDRLLDAVRVAVRREITDARSAVNALVSQQVAQGLAPEFLRRDRPYEANAQLAELIDRGILDRAAFIQKRPFVLQFYKRLLLAFDRPVRSVLEIGVKGGGSTSFWKAIFPDARVVGMDIKLQPWLTTPAADGVVYIQGDQSDKARLVEVAEAHGPFDIVIDDGSHVSDHQALTLRVLLPHVTDGGFYVIEDVHANLKTTDGHSVDYGEDIWADFVTMMFARLRRGALPPEESTGGKLANHVAKRIGEVILSKRGVALRVVSRGGEGEA